MRKETAVEIYALAMNAISSLTMILNVLPENTSAEDLNMIKRGVGTSIGDIQTDLLDFINAKYPELDDLAN